MQFKLIPIVCKPKKYSPQVFEEFAKTDEHQRKVVAKTRD